MFNILNLTIYVKTKKGKTKIGKIMTTQGNGSLFGSYLRKLRGKKKLKLNAVALDLKIDPTLLSKYEGGSRFPKKEKLDRIATYFRVSKNEMARKISIDKQKTHYERLASKNETKIKETKTS